MSEDRTPGAGSSDFIVFIDESGDHGLAKIDRDYPVFVLCAALFRKDHYVHQVSTAFSALKMEFWGHDEIVLHEHDIRKPKNQFAFLQIEAHRNRFHERLTGVMHEARFKLVYSIIRKAEYAERYPLPRNPYDLSMSFVLERIFLELNSRGQGGLRTKVIVECRGNTEDAQLAQAFAKITGGDNACGRPLPFDLLMVPKLANSIGLQLADLAARPIGIRSLRPDQANRAFDIIKPKIRRDRNGKAEGWGVKVFP